MKHLLVLLCFVPLGSFSQHVELPLHVMYERSDVLKNKISSVSKRKIKMMGDSVVYNKILQQINFGETGSALEQITWNEWGSDSSVTDLRPFSALAGSVKSNKCDYKFKPVLQHIKELTGVDCLPNEFFVFAYGDIKLEKTIENDEIVEYTSVEDTSVYQYHYYLPDPHYSAHPQSTNSNDSLDMRIIIRTDLKNKTVEYQAVGIFDPPTDVPQTTYHRTVYHYDFSMKLLWKEEFVAGLGFYNDDRSEHKESQTIYDYYEDGLLKRELTFFQYHPYDFNKEGGIYMEQVLYEITYRE